MQGGRRRIGVILVSGVFFLAVFVALTVVALSSAELNVATVLFAAISLFVCVAVVGALIGAVRKPPEEG
jgi:hypothetical protein